MTRLAVLAALAPLLVVLGFGTVERTTAPWRGTELIGPIYGSHVVSQPFTPEGPVLTAIDVRLATYARRNDGVVTLRLRRLRGNEDLRTATVAAADLRDSALQRFRFAPFQISELGPVNEWTGAPPPLEFRVESSAPDEGNAVAISARQDPERLILVDSAEGPNPGVATLDGVRQSKNVAFAVVTQQPVPGLARAAIERLAAAEMLPIFGVLVLILPGLLLARLFLGATVSSDRDACRGTSVRARCNLGGYPVDWDARRAGRPPCSGGYHGREPGRTRGVSGGQSARSATRWNRGSARAQSGSPRRLRWAP